jgi:hypothetical protein
VTIFKRVYFFLLVEDVSFNRQDHLTVSVQYFLGTLYVPVGIVDVNVFVTIIGRLLCPEILLHITYEMPVFVHPFLDKIVSFFVEDLFDMVEKPGFTGSIDDATEPRITRFLGYDADMIK